MKRRILAIALLGSLLLSGCAKNEIDEIINESADEVSVEASDEASALEYELATAGDSADSEESDEIVDESTDEVSIAEDDTDTEEVEGTEAPAGTAEEEAKKIPVNYDETEFCGYYYRDGSSAYIVISAREEKGTYDITFYHEELGTMSGIGTLPSDPKDNSLSLNFVSDDGERKGFFMINPGNVMLTLLGIDESGKADVKIKLFPVKAE